MSNSIAQSILRLFVRPRTAALLCLGGILTSPLALSEWPVPLAWGAWEVPFDDSTDLNAAQQLLDAGQTAQALAAFQKLRTNSPDFAIKRDVDYLVLVSGWQSGEYQVAWDAGQTWRAAQPKEIFQSPGTATAENQSAWTSRREMAANVLMVQIQAAYQLALTASDLERQRQWLAQAETTCRELRSLQPSDSHLDPLAYHANLIALQQELRRSAIGSADTDSTARKTRFQQLADQFRASAEQATTAEWKHKNRYYSAVTLEMAGDLVNAILIWEELQKDLAVATEIRRLSLSALCEANLGRWFAANQSGSNESDQEIRKQWLLEARDRYHQIQREYPEFDTSRVAFNLGTCYRLLEDHPQAIQQFQKIQWPTQPDTNLGSAYLAWQAQFNQARSWFALRQFDKSQQVLDLALPRLNYAADSAAGQAILLRMRIAEQAADWPAILTLRQQGEAWLKLIPEHQPEVDFLAALAQFRSADQSAKSEGAKLLAAIAGQPQNPWADLAKFQLLPYQVEPDATRHTSSRISFDETTPEIQNRLRTAVQSAEELLSSAFLKVDNFPINPALLLPEQRDVLERRKEVRKWHANALYRLGEHAQSAEKFGALLQEFPSDSAVAEWTMKRAVGLAQSTSPAMALEQLTEALVQTWPVDLQAEGWWLRGELLRLKKEDLAAAQAYEKSLTSATEPALRLTAMESALGSYDRLSNSSEMVRLITQWEQKFTGTDWMRLLLQRGIANFKLKDFARAEADFSRLLSLASATTPVDQTQRGTLMELVADAQVNQGLAFAELGKTDEAKRSWETFLANYAEHEHRAEVTRWLQAIDPQWQAPRTGSEVSETSGTDKATLDQRYELAHQAFEGKQWAEASAAFAKLAEEAKSDARHDQILYYLGWSLREQDKLTEAKSAWEQLLSLHLDSEWVARSQFHLGEAEYREGNYTRAAERFQLAKTAATEAALQRSAIYMEAWSDLQRREFDLAKQKFQTIIDNAQDGERELPLVLEAFALVGQCDFQAGRMSVALTTYQAAAVSIDKLRTHKPDMHFQVCFNAGRAAIETDRPSDALTWLNKCVNRTDGAPLPASIDEMMQAEAKFLLGVARRLTKDLDGAASILSPLSGRPDTVGMRSLLELALLARGRGDERSAQRYYTAVANGAYGDQLSAQAIEWKAQAILDMGLSLLRSANQQTDAAVRAEHVRQAKTWLTRAQLQNDSTTVAQQAVQQLEQLKVLGL